MLTADFYPRNGKSAPFLDINVIENGTRRLLTTVNVADKWQARRVAAQHGAKCWNF